MPYSEQKRHATPPLALPPSALTGATVAPSVLACPPTPSFVGASSRATNGTEVLAPWDRWLVPSLVTPRNMKAACATGGSCKAEVRACGGTQRLSAFDGCCSLSATTVSDRVGVDHAGREGSIRERGALIVEGGANENDPAPLDARARHGPAPCGAVGNVDDDDDAIVVVGTEKDDENTVPLTDTSRW